jgi:DNA-binding GntR family transcriptional regulator
MTDMKAKIRPKSGGGTLPSGARGRPKGQGSQMAYEVLRTKIIRVELAPGADIDEVALQRTLEMSRTPLREALIRLEAEGLVTIESNVGVRVANLNFEDIPGLLEAIDLCQRAMTLWSVDRRSDADLVELEAANDAFAAAVIAGDAEAMTVTNTAFHMTIARACRNRELVRWYERLSFEAERLSNIVYRNDDENENDRALLVEHHRIIIQSLRDRDSAAVDEILKIHSAVFQSMLRKHVSSNLAYEIRFP